MKFVVVVFFLNFFPFDYFVIWVASIGFDREIVNQLVLKWFGV